MFCGDKAEENLVKEYNGVKIYPDTVFTLDNEDGTFDRQYYLTDLGFRKAWSISRGQGIKVAVVDSGVDDSHEYLAHAVIYTGSVIPQECYGDFLDESFDITYIPIKRGFLYLTAVIDWYSRCIVGWEVDDTLDTRMVINALKKAFKVAKPQILNRKTESGKAWMVKADGQIIS